MPRAPLKFEMARYAVDFSTELYDSLRTLPTEDGRATGLMVTVFDSTDPEIEVEYQSETIGKYGLSHSDQEFYLTPLQTDCLAKDSCGIPGEKVKKALSTLQASSCCQPGSSCC